MLTEFKSLNYRVNLDPDKGWYIERRGKWGARPKFTTPRSGMAEYKQLRRMYRISRKEFDNYCSMFYFNGE